MFFRGGCGPLRRLRAAPCSAFVGDFGGQPILLLETGIGRSAVDAALAWIWATSISPRFILFAGFGGALDDTLHVGDVLLADEVVDEAGGRWPARWPGPAAWAVPWLRRGRLLTTCHLVTSPEKKRRIGGQHHAHAVDMEAAHVAVHCAERNIPFGCVRAISDTVNTPLSPSLVALLSGGRVSLPRLVFALIRKPMLMPELMRLGRDTRSAARQLAAALRELLVLSATPKL
jgi:adenosylhomocysteine nucleosidase